MARPINEGAQTGWDARLTGRIVMAVVFTFLVSVLPVSGQQNVRAVRSAFVYNLTKYVAWPESKRTLLIGFIGDPSMGIIMKQVLKGKSSNGRTLEVLLNPGDSELPACDVIYITSAETAKLSSILPRIGRMPILTVGEDSHFTMDGGMIGLIRSGDQIQIEVNLSALEHGGLRMSSRLLELATIVSSKETMQ